MSTYTQVVCVTTRARLRLGGRLYKEQSEHQGLGENKDNTIIIDT